MFIHDAPCVSMMSHVCVTQLLSHTDLFKAGLARSGAYNRSLTPFGFQSEQRTYWSDTDLYIEMSPFTHVKSLAQRRNPILLIHGQVPVSTVALKSALLSIRAMHLSVRVRASCRMMTTQAHSQFKASDTMLRSRATGR